MSPNDAQTEFTRRLRSRGIELPAVDVGTGFSEAFAFYRDVRAEGCAMDQDGDMLLYQWGTYDWGQGRYFNLELTRQFMLHDVLDDAGIFQLALTFLFAPTTALERLRHGNHWCHSPTDLQGFERHIALSEAYRIAIGQVPVDVQLTYGASG